MLSLSKEHLTFFVHYYFIVEYINTIVLHWLDNSVLAVWRAPHGPILKSLNPLRRDWERKKTLTSRFVLLSFLIKLGRETNCFSEVW